jgi:glucose-1-phosphate thymidylyltransferase
VIIRNWYKPKETTLTYTWMCAVWGPAFTLYLHDLITELEPDWCPDDELHVGDVFQRALQDGLEIDAVSFPEGRYVDLGAPDELADLVGRGGTGPVPSP